MNFKGIICTAFENARSCLLPFGITVHTSWYVSFRVHILYRVVPELEEVTNFKETQGVFLGEICTAIQLVACLASENCWHYFYLTQVQGADQTPAETNEQSHWFHLEHYGNLSIDAVQSE